MLFFLPLKCRFRASGKLPSFLFERSNKNTVVTFL